MIDASDLRTDTFGTAAAVVVGASLSLLTVDRRTYSKLPWALPASLWCSRCDSVERVCKV